MTFFNSKLRNSETGKGLRSTITIAFVLVALAAIVVSAFTHFQAACPPKREYIAGSEVLRDCKWATGVVTHEEWRLEGKIHREDGPALIKRDPATGVVISEDWLREGRLHREDGPAKIWRDPGTAVVTFELWSREGKSHRKDGPAIIWRDPTTGAVTGGEWWLNGELQQPPHGTPSYPPLATHR